MKRQLVGSGYIVGVGALLSMCVLLRAPAQEARVDPTTPAVSTAPGAGGGASVNPDTAKNDEHEGKHASEAAPDREYSEGVDEILKMVKAGISSEVIRTYIESSPVAYSPTAADIISLKKDEVPDELTTAMMKRGAALKAQVSQAVTPNPPGSAHPGGSRRQYGLDPEGYDYFHYCYLYPRTLAAANQSFYTPGAFSPGFGTYGYGPGYYAPPAFWPMRPSAFGRP